MSGHGIGYPPQPNPAHVVVSRDSLLLHPPCCTNPVVLPRDGLDINAAQQLECPKCRLRWHAALRATLSGVSVSWRRAQRP